MSKRMREESSGEEGGKRNEPFPNVSAANNTSWGKQDGLSNSGLDRLDHPSDVNNNSPPRDVKLPGRSRNAPAVFPFGTKYLEMHDSLSREDNELYTKNGVLRLLLRNSKAKRSPERWQDAPGFEVTSFDIVLCFENRIFDICIEDAQNREPEEFKPLHFVAIPVKDTPEEAEKAEQDVICLARMLEETDDLEIDAASIVEKFEEETQRSLLHQVCHI